MIFKNWRHALSRRLESWLRDRANALRHARYAREAWRGDRGAIRRYFDATDHERMQALGKKVLAIGKAGMRRKVERSQQDMAELHALIKDDLVCELAEALEFAHNGLLWYQDAHPESRDGSDDEMNERIEAVLARVRG